MDWDDLYRRCGPVILLRVQRFYRKSRIETLGGRTPEGMFHEVFLKLIEHDGRALAKVDPARGSIEAYCVAFTDSRLLETLRSELRRQSIAPTDSLARLLEPASTDSNPETRVLAALFGRKLVDCIRSHIKSELGRELFDELYLRQRTDDEIVEALGVERRVIHQWRSTIKKLAERCMEELHARDPEK